MIEFDHVTKKYTETQAVSDLSLKIKTGELFVLVGSSGSGKTTTLKMINRLIEPSSGNIKINGKSTLKMPVTQLRHGIGYVLQSGALFPNMTAGQNAMIQLEAQGVPLSERKKRAQDLFTQVGLDPRHYFDRMPDQLSGGEQQRIGIVRALMAQPDIMLMDEPFSALDPLSRQTLQTLILSLHRKLNMTIVFVTHDMAEALKLGDRIGMMYRSKLQQVGTARDILTSPINEIVAQFFASYHEQIDQVQDLLQGGYWSKLENYNMEQKIMATAPISELAMMLQTYDYVCCDEKMITKDHLIAYLARGGQ